MKFGPIAYGFHKNWDYHNGLNMVFGTFGIYNYISPLVFLSMICFWWGLSTNHFILFPCLSKEIPFSVLSLNFSCELKWRFSIYTIQSLLTPPLFSKIYMFITSYISLTCFMPLWGTRNMQVYKDPWELLDFWAERDKLRKQNLSEMIFVFIWAPQVWNLMWWIGFLLTDILSQLLAFYSVLNILNFKMIHWENWD